MPVAVHNNSNNVGNSPLSYSRFLLAEMIKPTDEETTKYPVFTSKDPSLVNNPILYGTEKYLHAFAEIDDTSRVCHICGSPFDIRVKNGGINNNCYLNKKNGSRFIFNREHITHVMPRQKMSVFKTFPNYTKDHQKVVSIHCDIVFTDDGIEVGACYVVSNKYALLYASFVKVNAPLLALGEKKFNYEITRNDVINAHVDQKELLAELGKLISKKTIIIGYKLDLVFRCLGIVHSRFIDLETMQMTTRQYADLRKELKLSNDVKAEQIIRILHSEVKATMYMQTVYAIYDQYLAKFKAFGSLGCKNDSIKPGKPNTIKKGK
uniref:Exonuclease domain-containing protein n=1 Tax=Rhabditophanes sp. KR3021 TaxID=114890 RepID=A0AC35TTY0_9BILA